MRDLFEIHAASGSHPVRTTDAPLRKAVETAGGQLVIADAYFREALTGLDTPIVFVEATEAAKEFAAVGPLIEAARSHGLARSGAITAVGGGVVQDIACFVASVYMRGVRWTFLPTTLLAMVDSCIGGKSSINVGQFKNLVGTFYPPAEIVIPTAAVATLPPEHVAAGRCEAAKICFARGDEAWNAYLALGHDPEPLIALSLESKKWFVEIDEFDRNERLLLNFGHSFGHALESCTDYGVIHGVAVGVGCLAAVEASARLSPGLLERERVRALTADLRRILRTVPGLPRALADVTRERFFTYWRSDKKHTPEAYRPILLDERGYLFRAALAPTNGTDDLIWTAFADAREQLAA